MNDILRPSELEPSEALAKEGAPLALRISVTDRCNMGCRYCMPPEGVLPLPRSGILTFEEIARFVRVAGGEFGPARVRLTGGEPLVRRGLPELVAMLAAEGVADLALTTNGQRLAAAASDLKRAGLRRINVSLDSLDPETYAAVSGGGDVRRVLAGIEAARSAGMFPLKLNTVVLRGVNDDGVVDLARFALSRGLQPRFLELMPIGPARAFHAERFVPAAEVRARLARHFELRELPRRPGSSAREFLADDGAGRRGAVGFIASETEPFCSGCRRLRLTSTGQLIGCLARGEGTDVRSFLGEDSESARRGLLGALAGVLGAKRARTGFGTRRPMVAVGG